MQTRRLQLLLELSRRGSMRAVADTMGTTTSTVSQQIAALAAEVGVALLEPHGRRVRLTPAGRRLAEHAGTILAAVEAARVDLDPDAEPAGTLRVAGFATAIRRSLLPVVADLASTHPNVRLLIAEHEPADATALLLSDDVDLALTYDYNLAPTTTDTTITATPLWTATWALGVPADAAPGAPGGAVATFRQFRDTDWVVNSRNTADERVIRTIASMAGFHPNIAHQVDSLELVQDLIVAGLGVGLLPATRPTAAGVTLLPLNNPTATRPTAAGVTLLPLNNPTATLRCTALTRTGRARWPPLELVVRSLTAPAS